MWRRISVDASCKDGRTCDAVLAHDEIWEDVMMVGRVVAPSLVPVPLADGEGAILIKRRVVVDAKLG